MWLPLIGPTPVNSQILAIKTFFDLRSREPSNLARECKFYFQVSGTIHCENRALLTSFRRTIYFVSDRGGAPQIYRMPASGGNPERVTFDGSYNISPALSPDGRWLAYISRAGGGFKLHVMDLTNGSIRAITDTTADESPSFAPNSRLIVYATQQQGREALMTTTLDGKIKARLAGQGGDLREPDWGPFQNQ